MWCLACANTQGFTQSTKWPRSTAISLGRPTAVRTNARSSQSAARVERYSSTASLSIFRLSHGAAREQWGRSNARITRMQESGGTCVDRQALLVGSYVNAGRFQDETRFECNHAKQN